MQKVLRLAWRRRARETTTAQPTSLTPEDQASGPARTRPESDREGISSAPPSFSHS